MSRRINIFILASAIIVIVGASGYLFWLNFIDKNNHNSRDTISNSNTTDDLINTQTTDSDEALKFLQKNCKKDETKNGVWNCFTGGYDQVEKGCKNIGYNFDCDGRCMEGVCYKFASSGKLC